MATGGEGSTFGKYFLLKKIAAGGMGEIYLAKLKGPVGFEKLLVVKRILAQHVENQEFVDMFFAEARVAAQLNHSNIVQIFEMGEIEDAYFIGMEYVHGKSLRDVIDRARDRGEYIHPAHAIEIIRGLCAGMSYAHNAKDMSGQSIGIVHRDINPHNLLVSYSGEVKIIDFGIAKSEMSLHKTETGTIKGKFVYMSPEQSAAEKLDKRSDLFAIGICLYEALTFTNPFARANIVLSLDAIQRKDVPKPSETNAKLAPLDPILAKALAKKAEDRYADCADFAQELLALVRSGVIEEPKQTLAQFMHDLFEEQIESEKRMILETDQANTTQLEKMKDFRRAEHRSGSQKVKVKNEAAEEDDWDEDAAAHTSSMTMDEAPRSRLPFILLLCSILLGTTAAAVAVMRLLQSRHSASTITEITPAPTVASVIPVEQPKLTPPPPKAEPPKVEPPPIAQNDNEDRRHEPRERNKLKNREREERAEAQPQPEPPPAPKAPAVATGFGNMSMSSQPPVTISLGGGAIGQTLKLKQAVGTFTFGSGKDPAADPFKITIRYRVTGSEIVYVVDAEPWAIVRGKGGIGLGKTPLQPVTGEGTSVFEFKNPKEGREQRVTLRWAP